MKDIAHSICRVTLIGAALAAALTAKVAEAHEVIGAMANNAGGEILLTDDKCDNWSRPRCWPRVPL